LSARNVLIFAAPELERLRAELLAATPLESAAFAFARAVRTPRGKWRLVVHEWHLVGDADYDTRNEVGIDLPPRVVAAAIKRARDSQSALVLVHSHPGFDPTPSARDRRGESLVVPAFHRRVPSAPIARLILSPAALSSALLGNGADDEQLEVVEVGADIRFYRPAVTSAGIDARFDRHVRAFGPDGQAVLRRLSIAIIGLGGTGSVAAQQLAHLGVPDFVLVDPEVLEDTNTTRVVGSAPVDVGKAKVDVAAAMIRRINPEACVDARRADIRDRSVLRALLDVDVFLCCTDSQGSRAALTQLAYQYIIPGIDVGVVIYASGGRVSHISGRVQMLAPGLACLLCGAVLDPETVRRDLLTDAARAADPYVVGGAAPQPAVISINSATSSLAVTMLLSAITGVPIASRHQRLRLESGIVSSVQTTAADNCPWCSRRGAFARGDSWPMPGRA
jgi:hypothetical protein